MVNNINIETVDIRNNKGAQIVEIPKEFAIEDTKAYLKKTGNVISIIPYHHPWQNFSTASLYLLPILWKNEVSLIIKHENYSGKQSLAGR